MTTNNEHDVITTPPPVPNPIAPLPTASISASPSPINPGQSALLTWSSENAVSANLSNVGPVAVAGSQTVSPTVSTNYTLKVTSADGASQTENAVVMVTGTPNPPPVPPPPPGFCGSGCGDRD